MSHPKKAPPPYRATCPACDWRGPVRSLAETAMRDQEDHAGSPGHRAAIRARDAPP